MKMAIFAATLPIEDPRAERVRTMRQQQEMADLRRKHKEENEQADLFKKTKTTLNQKATFTHGSSTFPTWTSFSKRHPILKDVVVPDGTEVIDLTCDDAQPTNTEIFQRSRLLQPVVKEDFSNSSANRTQFSGVNEDLTPSSSSTTTTILEDPEVTRPEQHSHQSSDATARVSLPTAQSNRHGVFSTSTPKIADEPVSMVVKSTQKVSRFQLDIASSRLGTHSSLRANLDRLKPQKGHKRLLPDHRPEIANSKLRGQRLDRSSILKTPSSLSREPSWKTLEQHRKAGGFINNSLHDESSQKWAPELMQTLQRLSPEAMKSKERTLVVNLRFGRETSNLVRKKYQNLLKSAAYDEDEQGLGISEFLKSGSILPASKPAFEKPATRKHPYKGASQPYTAATTAKSFLRTPRTPSRLPPAPPSIRSTRREKRKRKIIDLSDQESDFKLSDDEINTTPTPAIPLASNRLSIQRLSTRSAPSRNLFGVKPSILPPSLDTENSPRQKRKTRIQAEHNMARIAQEIKLPTTLYEKIRSYDTGDKMSKNGLEDRMGRMSVTPTPIPFNVKPKPKPKAKPKAKLTSTTSSASDTISVWNKKRANGDRHVAKQQRIGDVVGHDIDMEDLPGIERFEMVDGIIVDKNEGSFWSK